MARIGKIVPALVLLFVVSSIHSKAENGRAESAYLVIFTLASVVYGYVHWMVTRWRFEGDTLRIETGLIRKDSRRLPLARIQAVDIVRPLLARLLGVSELRVRLAGSGSTDGKLAFLSESQAAELRIALLAGHIDAEVAVSSNTGLPMASVDTGRLLASTFLSLITIVLAGTIGALAVLDQFEPKTAAAVAGILAVYLISAAGVIWRRLSGQYAFIAVEAPEGVRIRRGLLQTISETVPYARIQAVRQVEPLLWRPFGWCAWRSTSPGPRPATNAARERASSARPFSPWGPNRTRGISSRACSAHPIRRARPRPAAPGFKAPLSFHFLSAGHDSAHAVCVTGRLNRATTWVPLEKSQSIRRVQGPLQRPLGLATVHVDVAGKRARAEFRDREVEEADRLVATLTELSRSARLQARTGPRPTAADAAPSGWYQDPGGRHELRYWHEGRWTEHVANGGRRSADLPMPSPTPTPTSP